MNILVLIVSLFWFFRSSFAVFELASNIVDVVQKSLKINTFTTAKTAFLPSSPRILSSYFTSKIYSKMESNLQRQI